MKNRMIFEAKYRNGKLKYKFNRKALLRDGGLLYLLGDTTQSIIRKSEMTEAEVLETVGYLLDNPNDSLNKVKHNFNFAYNEKNKKIRAENPITAIVEISKIIHRRSNIKNKVLVKRFLVMALTYHESCVKRGVFWFNLFFSDEETLRKKHPNDETLIFD